MDMKDSNLVEGSAGTDTKTIDMSGTNMPGATNEKSIAEKAQDIKDTKTPEKLSTVKIRLTMPHTHEGIKFDAGDFIEVDAQSAEYIVETSKSGVKV